MSVRVRIAPSPTGNLHIGTARTAVFNWLFARHYGGQFILRIEDTDVERSRPEYTQNILDGLSWLGLNWDAGPVFQSKRLDLYQNMVQTLLDKGAAYRCYTTEAELDEMRAAQEARKEAPRYDNRHRDLTPAQQSAFEAEGRTAVIRFKINDDRQITWNDLVRGSVTWRASDLGGDMVIARASTRNEIGQPLYNFAVVVDDIDMRITHVIRGEDHIANTAKQILLYEAFGTPIPVFAHTPLILDQSGKKLSKRDGVTSISDFKQKGYTAEALVNYMTLLGWSPPDNKEVFTLAEAASQFSFERVNKAGGKFDWDKLNWLNSQYIHNMAVSELTELLIPYWEAAGYKFDPVRDRAWLEQLTALIGPSLTRLEEAVAMSRMFFVSSVQMNEEAAAELEKEGATAVLEAVLAALGGSPPLTDATAGEIVNRVTKEQKVKKGLVMRSLRVALTGEVHGPDLIQSWVLLHQRGLDRTRLEKVLKINVEEASDLPEDTLPPQPVVNVVTETPTPLPPPVTVVVETPEFEPPPETQSERIKRQIVEISANLPDYVTRFVKEYQSPLIAIGVILATLVILKVLFAVLSVLNSIPLVQPTFEIIGMGYSGWFVYRYLLSASTRQELSLKINSIKEYIAGDNSPTR